MTIYYEKEYKKDTKIKNGLYQTNDTSHFRYA